VALEGWGDGRRGGARRGRRVCGRGERNNGSAGWGREGQQGTPGGVFKRGRGGTGREGEGAALRGDQIRGGELANVVSPGGFHRTQNVFARLAETLVCLLVKSERVRSAG
jgi:hypothetical protein